MRVESCERLWWDPPSRRRGAKPGGHGEAATANVELAVPRSLGLRGADGSYGGRGGAVSLVSDNARDEHSLHRHPLHRVRIREGVHERAERSRGGAPDTAVESS